MSSDKSANEDSSFASFSEASSPCGANSATCDRISGAESGSGDSDSSCSDCAISADGADFNSDTISATISAAASSADPGSESASGDSGSSSSEGSSGAISIVITGGSSSDKICGLALSAEFSDLRTSAVAMSCNSSGIGSWDSFRDSSCAISAVIFIAMTGSVFSSIGIELSSGKWA